MTPANNSSAVPAGWKALTDVQWMNIVNHDHAYHGYSKDDAVHYAVKATEAKLKEINAAPPQSAPVASEWISVDERLPEVDVGVLVYAPPQAGDHPGDDRISFDCIDPNDDERASWLNHNEHYEHFCCVAKPEGSIGPSEKAPYTHWMPLPPAPITTKEQQP